MLRWAIQGLLALLFKTIIILGVKLVLTNIIRKTICQMY